FLLFFVTIDTETEGAREISPSIEERGSGKDGFGHGCYGLTTLWKWSAAKLKYVKLDKQPTVLRTFDGNSCELSQSGRLTLTTGDTIDMIIGADLLCQWECTMD
ncbi:hypothetical protein FOZ61_005595, partial [Perkinsus olseni]